MLQHRRKTNQNLSILKESYKNYRNSKIKMELLILLVGLLIIIAYCLNNFTLEKGNYVRPYYGESSEAVTVIAGLYEQAFPVKVQALELTQQKAKELYGELTERLPELIKGGNSSLDEVYLDLTLPTMVSEYPFRIEWHSDQTDLVSDSGEIQKVPVEKDTVILLDAVISFEQYEWIYQIPIHLIEREISEEETYYQELYEYISASELNSSQEEIWKVPENFQGEILEVYEIPDYTVCYLVVLLVLSMICYWFAHDQELQKRRDGRRQEFAYYYEGIVSKLAMYVSAGLTMQGAMKQCMNDYSKSKASSYIIESFDYLKKEIHNGISFYKGLELWAEYCDYYEYEKLVSIIKQGERNDSSGVSFLLMTEAKDARRAKLGEVRVKGNHISTKLLIPMMLQLGLVMALIMIPAFLTFQM